MFPVSIPFRLLLFSRVYMGLGKSGDKTTAKMGSTNNTRLVLQILR
jgi:hypothetical protein